MKKNIPPLLIIGVALLASGCKLFDVLGRSADRMSRQAEHIADSIQAGQVGVQIGIQQALQLVGEELPDFKRSLNGLAQTATIAAGNQVRCTIDMVRVRVAQSIRDIFNRRRGTNPVVCGSDVPVIVVADVVSGERRYITFGGFDIPQGLTAWVTDNTGARLTEVSENLLWNSAYVEVLMVQGTALQALTQARAAKIVLLNGATLMSEVGIDNIPPICRDRPNELTPASTIDLRPAAATSGDNEFNGHGPMVRWTLKLRTDASRKLLQADLSFMALERDRRDAQWLQEWYDSSRRGRPDNPPSQRRLAEIERQYQEYLAQLRANNGAIYRTIGDDTGTSASRTFTLWTAPSGFEIQRIQSPTEFSDTYFDTNHDIDTFYPGSPIASIDITGDTDGDDIGRSGIKVSFNAVTVHIVETENCTPNPITR